MRKLSTVCDGMQIIATQQGRKTRTFSDGSGIEDGKTITQYHPDQPLTVETLRTTRSVIESMKQRNSLTVCAETRGINIPQKDSRGDIYAWESSSAETGNYKVTVTDPTDEEIEAIKNTVIAGHKRGIQNALERLAQIKPIGRSEIKQGAVIGYLSFDMFDEGISEYVVNELCKEYRQMDEDDPAYSRFFPDSGVFYNKAKERMKKYQSIYQALFPKQEPAPDVLPKPEKTLKQISVETKKMPWEGFTFESMPDDVKYELIRFCGYSLSESARKTYCDTYGIDYDRLIAWKDSNNG